MITIEASPAEIYDIELEHSLLEANAKLARENRAVLDQRGITAIDFMGAIGSGQDHHHFQTSWHTAERCCFQWRCDHGCRF